MIECDGCGVEYDPVGCRWRCPKCGLKSSCCEGEAQDSCTHND